MSWCAVPAEVLECIFIHTGSPIAIGNACLTCKSWAAVGEDPLLWKNLFRVISNYEVIEEPKGSWKRKVVDQILVQQNVQNARCVIRTVAATRKLEHEIFLEFDNYSCYKDYCLLSWIMMDEDVEIPPRCGHSHLINMVTDNVVQVNYQELFFMNNYLATSESYTHGGPVLETAKVLPFDPHTISSLSSKSLKRALKFNFSSKRRRLLRNICAESHYVGFVEDNYNTSPNVLVVDARLGELVCLRDKSRTYQCTASQLYDKYLALKRDEFLEVINVETSEMKTKRFNLSNTWTLGFMTEENILIQTDNEVMLWNYINNTEKCYPLGTIPREPIRMIYHDMWLVVQENCLSFFNTKDGTKINDLNMSLRNLSDLSVLSDGRLNILDWKSCRTLSLFDSEVNRKIKVEVVSVDGKVESHEIAAYELSQFFVTITKQTLDSMTSRVVPYIAPSNQEERFVMVFSRNSQSVPVNDTATRLLKQAVEPIHLNTPYTGWAFGLQVWTEEEEEYVDEVCGDAIFVREQKFDGRWQLVSIK